MKNVPLPKTQHGNDLSVITPNGHVKNELILGIKVILIRVRNVDEDISKLNDNIVSDGRGLQVDVKKQLASARDLKKIFTCWFAKNSEMDLLRAQV